MLIEAVKMEEKAPIEKYDFDIIYDKLIKDEGGYTNDPKDSGGETYKGISRKNYPNNPIWVIIDAHRNEYNFMPFLETSEELAKQVKEFYYNLYKKNKIHELHDFNLKEKLFSTIVNTGKVRGSVILQKSFNLLKRSQILAEDGVIGKNTIKHINSLSKKGKEDLLMFYKAELYCFYKQLTINRPKDKRFLKGWTRRAFS
jgi:lysozyme family protein